MRQLLGTERLHNDRALCDEGHSAFRMTIAAGKFHALSPPRLLVAAFGREAGSQAYGLRLSPHTPRSTASTTQESQHGKLFSRLASASGLPYSLVTRIASSSPCFSKWVGAGSNSRPWGNDRSAVASTISISAAPSNISNLLARHRIDHVVSLAAGDRTHCRRAPLRTQNQDAQGDAC